MTRWRDDDWGRGMSDAPELRERLVQLGAVDRARAVAVKVAEDVLPILDVFPQACELVEADCPAPVRILCRSRRRMRRVG